MNILRLSIVLFVVDMIWLQLVFKHPFGRMIQDIQGSPMQIRMMGAVVAYLALFGLAAMFLNKVDNDFDAFLFGFFVYAVYDGTNYATMKGWDAKLAIIDSVWGGVLFTIVRRLMLI